MYKLIKAILMQTIALIFITILGYSIAVARQKEPLFKVIAFYSATWDGGHISFAHEANSWFPEMAKKYNFVYDSTNNWSNLNQAFLAQYQVVLFLDNQPPASQRSEFEQYMKNGGAWMGFHVVAFNQNPKEWDWYYNQFLGMGSYKNNTWAPTPAVLKVEDRIHPATANLPDTFSTSPNEWYAWMVDLREKKNIKILCSIDPASFPLGTGTGNGGANEIWHSGYYPVVWTNTDYKMLYSNMGHNLVDYGKNNKTLSWTFKNEIQNKLVLDGLFWLASLNMPDPRATKIEVAYPKNGSIFKEHDTIEIIVNANDSDGIAKIECYNESILLGKDSIAPYRFAVNDAQMGNYNILVKVVDSLGNVASAWVSFSVQGEGPYNKKVAQIPGKIEAENFDYGGESVGYSDNEANNQGGQYRTTEGVDIEACSDIGAGFNIGYTNAGEWLKYTVNIIDTGEYTIQTRVASTGSGKKLYIELNNINISGSITVPNTNGWQNWKTIYTHVLIPDTGVKTLKIIFETGGFNLNYINFTKGYIASTKYSVNTPNIEVFPNPSKGIIHLKTMPDAAQNTTIEVFDYQGRRLKQVHVQLNSNPNETIVDLLEFGKGVYLLGTTKSKEKVKVVVL